MNETSIWMNDYVEAGFENVVDVLRSRPSLLRAAGADRATSRRARQAFPREGAHQGHRHLATVEVNLRDVDGRLRFFALAGGTQEPITEILLEGTSRAAEPAHGLATARTFLDNLAHLLSEELRGSRVA